MLQKKQDATYLNNRGKTDYTCLHSQINKDLQY